MVLAIAHRAGNSLAGLHEANQLGVDVIECDVHHHRGRLEVRHLKTAGPLPFLWDKWELVSASAPRLGMEELLEADRHGTTFMIDLKGPRPGGARQLAALLHERQHDRKLYVCGRWWPPVERVAELPYVLPVLSARNRFEFPRLRRRLETGPAVHGVSVHRSHLTAPVVDWLHRHVQVVMTWPVNDLRTLDEMLDIGVTGVISDEPEILSELIARRSAS